MKTESNRKIFYITWICTAIVIALTVWTMVRSRMPTQGKPYERLTAEEARLYMSYEAAYLVADVRDEEEYDLGHLDEAISIPYDRIVEEADRRLGDRNVTVYVYGKDSEQSCAAAQKLSDIGFNSVSEIGSYGDWIMAQTETETEGLLGNVLE